MSTRTQNLGLFKYDTINDSALPFSIQDALNQNWDILDEKVGNGRNIGEIITSTIPLTDAGLHLLDGARLSGDGIYKDFVDYIAELYEETSVVGYRSNVTKVGSLTDNNGVLSGFSASNYARTPVMVNLSNANTWEIVTKHNITSVQSINDGFMGVLGGAYNVNYYINSANKVTVELSSDGNSYNIGQIPMLTPISLNTDFYLKLNFTGTSYNLYYSTDDENYILQGSISSSAKVSNRTNYFAFGVDESENHTSWNGAIDLKGSYININGQRWWTGAYEIKPCFTTEVEWQASITQYGSCGKFVYDRVNNTVRLPKVTGKIEGTTDVTALGDLAPLLVKLPNITVGAMPSWDGSASSGALQKIGDTNFYSYYQGGSLDSSRFDASRCSSVYSGNGSDTTIHEQAIKVLYYIVIANSTKTDIQVDIDEIVTDLNGKADVDLTNCTNVADIKMAGASMPSNTYIDLTLGASGTSYTAPADGFVYICKSNSADTYYDITLRIPNVFKINDARNINGNIDLIMPVKKGQTFVVDWWSGSAGAVIEFRFIYAQGSESEAN